MRSSNGAPIRTSSARARAAKGEDGKSAGIVLTESTLRQDGEPALSDVRNALVAVYGTDYGNHSPTWISRFTDMTRQAAAYRDRRVLLAGDAAHVHPPVGGQGLGPVAAPTAVLIRPDGYVAWVGDRMNAGLADALTAWFGPPAAT